MCVVVKFLPSIFLSKTASKGITKQQAKQRGGKTFESNMPQKTSERIPIESSVCLPCFPDKRNDIAINATPDSQWTELRRANTGLGDASAMIFEMGGEGGDIDCHLEDEILESTKAEEETSEEDSALIKGFMMSAAAASAMTGVTKKHGGPFGATIVRDGVFISLAHNTVLKDYDPTCHAEMNAIRYACKALQSHDLSDCELFTTCGGISNPLSLSILHCCYFEDMFLPDRSSHLSRFLLACNSQSHVPCVGELSSGRG